jgi:hypothetical protein
MKAQRRFVSGPCIARLLARHRMSANEAMRAGRYGRLFHVGRIVYVDLTEVEHTKGLEVPAYNIDTGETRTLIIKLTRDEQYNEAGQIVAKARVELRPVAPGSSRSLIPGGHGSNKNGNSPAR